MAVEAVVFDVGETLVDETGAWIRIAHAAGVTPFTPMAALGATIAQGRPHQHAWETLGIDRPLDEVWGVDELRPRVDFVGSAEGWGLEKPDQRFFARLADESGVEPAKIAHVGDRVDNDVVPALAAGMTAVHIKRGPWGYLQQPPAEATCITSLDELPEALR